MVSHILQSEFWYVDPEELSSSLLNVSTGFSGIGLSLILTEMPHKPEIIVCDKLA